MKSRYEKYQEIVSKYCSKNIAKENEAMEKAQYDYCGDGGILCVMGRFKGRTTFLEELYEIIPKYIDHKARMKQFRKEMDEWSIPKGGDIVEMNVYEVCLIDEAYKFRRAHESEFKKNWLG